MSPITRGWIAFAAVGAGLIHLALAVDAPPISAALLALIGIAEFAWGTLVMFDGRFLIPRIAVVAVLAPIGLWIAALLFGTASFRPLPLAIATLFELFVAIVLARGLRLRNNRGPVTASTGRLVAGLVIAALVVGTVTVMALSATQAGQPLVDPSLFDGEHH